MDSGTECQEHAEVARLQIAGARSLVDEDGERCRAGVAETVDVRGELVRGNTELIADVVIDPGIGLMGQKPVDRVDRSLGLEAERSRAFGQFGHGELEELAPVHRRDVLLLVVIGALPVRPRSKAAAFHVEQSRRSAVGAELHAAKPGIPLGRAKHEGPRAVPEEHGQRPALVGQRLRLRARVAAARFERGPILPRHEPGVGLGADEENRPRVAILHQSIDDLQDEEHRGTLLTNVERGRFAHPQFVREQGA